MSLINSEYPIGEQFNYHEYIKNSGIPGTYEGYVQKIATHFYNENKKITLSLDNIIFCYVIFVGSQSIT